MFNSSKINNSSSSSPATNKSAKRCRVCGDDISVFYNYNGLCCKSCKKFFLRNAFKSDSLQCRDGDNPARAGKCRLDKVYRRYCKSCRMLRCIQIGMKKELISARKKPDPVQKENIHKSSGSFIQMAPINSSMILPTSILPSTNPFELSDYELQWISIVQRATSVFVMAQQYEVVGQPKTILEAINIGEMFSRKYVEFCKGLPHFKAISTEEQLLLLKAAFPEISSISIAFLYSPEEGGFPVVVNEEGTKAYFIKAGLQTKYKKKKDVGTIWSRFIYSMHMELENDIVIRDLIYAQLLFKERENVVNCLEVTRYQHNIWRFILKRWLQKKYANEVTAEIKYSSIMYLLEQIDDATNTIRSVLKRIEDTSQVAQVLAEMYNLV